MKAFTRGKEKSKKKGEDSSFSSGGNPMMRGGANPMRKQRGGDDGGEGGVGKSSPMLSIRKSKVKSKKKGRGGGSSDGGMISSGTNPMSKKKGRGGGSSDGGMISSGTNPMAARREVLGAKLKLKRPASPKGSEKASGITRTLDGDLEASVLKIHRLRGKLKRKFRICEDALVTLTLDGRETNRFAFATQFDAVSVVANKPRLFQLRVYDQRTDSSTKEEAAAAAAAALSGAASSGAGSSSMRGGEAASACAVENTAESTAKLYGPEWDVMSEADRDFALASLELSLCRDRASNMSAVNLLSAAVPTPAELRRSKREQAKLARQQAAAEKKLRRAAKRNRAVNTMTFMCQTAADCARVIAAIDDGAADAAHAEDDERAEGDAAQAASLDALRSTAPTEDEAGADAEAGSGAGAGAAAEGAGVSSSPSAVASGGGTPRFRASSLVANALASKQTADERRDELVATSVALRRESVRVHTPAAVEEVTFSVRLVSPGPLGLTLGIDPFDMGVIITAPPNARGAVAKDTRGEGVTQVAIGDRIERVGNNKRLPSFQLVDTNGDGKVDVDELNVAFAKLTPSFTREEAVDLVQQYDSNGDGEIDFEEFESLAREAMLTRVSDLIRTAPRPFTLHFRRQIVANAPSAPRVRRASTVGATHLSAFVAVAEGDEEDVDEDEEDGDDNVIGLEAIADDGNAERAPAFSESDITVEGPERVSTLVTPPLPLPEAETAAAVSASSGTAADSDVDAAAGEVEVADAGAAANSEVAADAGADAGAGAGAGAQTGAEETEVDVGADAEAAAPRPAPSKGIGGSAVSAEARAAALAAAGGDRKAAFFNAAKADKAAAAEAVRATRQAKLKMMSEEQREEFIATEEKEKKHAAQQKKHLVRMAKKSGGGRKVNPLKRGKGRSRKKKAVTKV